MSFSRFAKKEEKITVAPSLHQELSHIIYASVFGAISKTVEQLDDNQVDDSQIDCTRYFYAPCHPHARRMLDDLKKKFNITSYKETTTLGSILFKRRPQKHS